MTSILTGSTNFIFPLGYKVGLVKWVNMKKYNLGKIGY
jgi:hypothetical protein